VGVIALATGQTFRETFAPIARIETAHAVGNTALGALAAAVWVTAPQAAPGLALVSALCFMAYRQLSPARRTAIRAH
jgi:hypothetical protein